jgi:hypothetical protein
MTQEITVDTEVEPDELFEKFLKEKTAELDERRRKTVKRLARGSFYSEDLFAYMFPKDAAEPPDIVYKDESPFVRLRYNIDDIKASEDIVHAFVEEHWDRFEKYRTLP